MNGEYNKYCYAYESGVGKIWIQADEKSITRISYYEIKDALIQETTLIKEAFKQIEEYLDGKRTVFELPLNAQGTPFQKKVWKALQNIPFGETRSYKQIAEVVGNPQACRAVGLANNKNPISIAIPCHRVIGTNGKLVGYAGGLKAKEKLLRIEKIILI